MGHVCERDLGRLLEENVVDAGLRGWIIPDFLTTTRDDRVVASVLRWGRCRSIFRIRSKLFVGYRL